MIHPDGPEEPVGWHALTRAHAVTPLIVYAMFLIVTLFASHAFPGTFEVIKCKPADADDLLVPTGAFTLVVTAFFLGGLLGRLPTQTVEPGNFALFVSQLGLTVMCGAIAFAWWYETSAVASADKKPITQYIMCIKEQQSDWILLVFVIGAVMAGRWLWHRKGTPVV